MRRALLLVNRRSREGEEDLEPGLELLRKAGFELTEEYPDDPGAIPATIRRHRESVDLVILGGGDGTLNTAAGAVAECDLPMGILPMGTANDLARTLSIPRSLIEACRVIAERRVHRIDAGWVNGNLFFNAASIGLAVRVTHHLSAESKFRWGVAAYLQAFLRAQRENRSFAVEILCDGQILRHRSIQVTVGNGRHYGGGMTIAEEAQIDDRRLHLYSLAPLGLWSLLRLAPSLRRGRYPQREKVKLLSGRQIEIRTRSPLPVDTDGELTTHTPAVFRVLENFIPVLVPRDYNAGTGGNENAA